jgi:hypothetical protein
MRPEQKVGRRACTILYMLLNCRNTKRQNFLKQVLMKRICGSSTPCETNAVTCVVHYVYIFKEFEVVAVFDGKPDSLCVCCFLY